jgi:hypothetical protein
MIMSRSRLAAVALGFALLAAASSPTTSVARRAAPKAQPAPTPAVVAATGQTAFEFIGQLDQVGPSFSFYGYLTYVKGIPSSQLFSNPAAPGEATALFTFHATATLTGRSILKNLFVVTAAGRIDFYRRASPGATFTDPTSFRAGSRLARASVRYQSILNVQTPDNGLATGAGELAFGSAQTFTLGNKRYRFGLPGLRVRVFATGQGTRFEPTLPRASLALAGNAVATARG